MSIGGRKQTKNQSATDLMTRSLDPSLLDSCTVYIQDPDVRACMHQAEMSLTQSLHCPESLTNIPFRSPDVGIRNSMAGAPLPAASTLVPVPESLVSPSGVVVPPVPSTPHHEKPNISSEKLQTIRSKAQEKRDKKIDKGNNNL